MRAVSNTKLSLVVLGQPLLNTRYIVVSIQSMSVISPKEIITVLNMSPASVFSNTVSTNPSYNNQTHFPQQPTCVRTQVNMI